MTVAIHFSFNQTLPRGQEGLTPLRVIEIMAPEGIQLKVRRPKDVQRLKRENYVVGSPGHLKDKKYERFLKVKQGLFFFQTRGIFPYTEWSLLWLVVSSFFRGHCVSWLVVLKRGQKCRGVQGYLRCEM